MITPLPELSRCRACGTTPAISSSGITAFVFCPNEECPGPVNECAFRAEAALDAAYAWQRSNSAESEHDARETAAAAIAAVPPKCTPNLP